jgi:hypothetical protein
MDPIEKLFFPISRYLEHMGFHDVSDPYTEAFPVWSCGCQVITVDWHDGIEHANPCERHKKVIT